MNVCLLFSHCVHSSSGNTRMLFSIPHHRKKKTELLIPLWYLLTSFWNRNKVLNNTVVSDRNDTTILTITCAQISHLPTYLRLSIIQFYNNIIFISTLILKITGMVIEICFQLIITLGDFEYSFHQQKHLNDIHFFFLVHSRLWTGVTGGVAVLGGGGLWGGVRGPGENHQSHCKVQGDWTACSLWGKGRMDPVLLICQDPGFLLLARMMGHFAFVLLTKTDYTYYS